MDSTTSYILSRKYTDQKFSDLSKDADHVPSAVSSTVYIDEKERKMKKYVDAAIEGIKSWVVDQADSTPIPTIEEGKKIKIKVKNARLIIKRRKKIK